METKSESRSLVQIMNDHMVMGEILNDVGGELDQTTEQWLEENKNNLGKKADGYKAAMDILDNAEEYLKAKAKPFIEAAKVCSNKREALKDRLKFAMKVLELKQIEGQDYVFTLSNGANKLVIDQEDAIPAVFFTEKTICELDKEALKTALENPEQSPIHGAHLETITTLRVKVNATTIKPKKLKEKKDATTNND